MRKRGNEIENESGRTQPDWGLGTKSFTKCCKHSTETYRDISVESMVLQKNLKRVRMAGAWERERESLLLSSSPPPTPTTFVSSRGRPRHVLTSWTWSKGKGATIGKGPEWGRKTELTRVRQIPVQEEGRHWQSELLSLSGKGDSQAAQDGVQRHLTTSAPLNTSALLLALSGLPIPSQSR